MLRLGCAALAALALAGCGSSDDAVGGGAGATSARGDLVIALPDRPMDLDPLLADTRSEQLVVRQIDEPLIAALAGPYGDVRRLPGLALSARRFDGGTGWRLRLRSGVRFQDGTLLSAAAVLANLERWRTTPEGRSLLPGLVAADAPRPDLVRLFFNRPVPGLPQLLASPRLGIVSPLALEPRSGTQAGLRRVAGVGTGPFELRERGAETVLVARNADWWGTRQQLGPALETVEFRVVPGAAERLGLLRRGEVQVADRLKAPQARRLHRDPLLTELPGADGTVLGLERSVRGFESGTEIPSLSGAWLTRIGAR